MAKLEYDNLSAHATFNIDILHAKCYKSSFAARGSTFLTTEQSWTVQTDLLGASPAGQIADLENSA